jgi:hypothetical protein
MNIRPEMLNALRAYYTQGTRVMLIHMDDPYTMLKYGDEGTVIAVDDTGTVHVVWD